MSTMLADPSTFQDHQYTVLVQGCDLSADLLISADFEIKMFTLEISKDPRQNDFLLFLLLPYTSLLVAFGLDGPQSFVRSHCSTGNRHIEYLSHSTLSFSPVHPLFQCVPETCRYLHHFFKCWCGDKRVEVYIQGCDCTPPTSIYSNCECCLKMSLCINSIFPRCKPLYPLPSKLRKSEKSPDSACRRYYGTPNSQK